MKTKTLTLLLLIISYFCNAQSYLSFFSNNSTKYSLAHKISCYSDDYSPNNLGPCVSTFDYTINSSTSLIYNDKIYFIVSNGSGILYPDPPYFEGILLREDTITGKIYRYIPSINDEVLICDMSLNEGDTFQLFPSLDITTSSWNNYQEKGVKIKVDSVRYINNHKIIYFPSLITSDFYSSQNEYNISIKFIEGIGPTYGPFGYFDDGLVSRSLPVLLCVDKENTQVFMQNTDLQCFQFSSDIKESILSDFSIYPNPASDYLTIETSNEKFYNVYFYDIIGLSVAKYSFNNLINISLDNFKTGIYFLVFLDESNVKSVKKISIFK